MCLILWRSQPDAAYPLVLMANRDEFYARPTQPAGWWADHPGIYGGRDLVAGGTWLAMSTLGRWAALTNIRDLARFDPAAPSRGALITNYLIGAGSAAVYIEQLRAAGTPYNGYNLLLGDGPQVWHYNNYADAASQVVAGVHGLSNATLNTPWPKVVRGKAKLAALAKANPLTPAPFFNALGDLEPAPDAQLPETGVGLEKERLLSPMFIKMAEYGTRCSTVLLFRHDGNVTFAEQTHADGRTRIEHIQLPRFT
ncbi:MAG: NRDE family protein [Rhodothermales bacterium]